MSILEDTNVDNSEYELSNDNTGLAEIQKAIEEIENLKNQEAEEEVKEESEEKADAEIVEQETAEEEISEKKQKKEDKLWQLKKDKYRALAAKEALMQENVQLKQMLSDSLNSGTYHYGKSAFADLEKAKHDKKKAIENGDVDALIESDIALTKALNTVNDLEKWSYNDTQNKTQSKQPVEESTPNNFSLVEQEIAADWLDSHSYLQPTSSDYNPKLANQVADFINYLDTNLAKNGQMDIYFSDKYFQTIENHIEKLKGEPQRSAKKVESNAHVGSVRNSYQGSGVKSSSPTQMILSADEKRMCANAGISEKDWLRYKLEDLKKVK